MACHCCLTQADSELVNNCRGAPIPKLLSWFSADRNFPKIIIKKYIYIFLLFLSHLKLCNIFCPSLKTEATLVSSEKIMYSWMKVFSLWALEWVSSVTKIAETAPWMDLYFCCYLTHVYLIFLIRFILLTIQAVVFHQTHQHQWDPLHLLQVSFSFIYST